jgi:acyl-CoA thioester hydrolase
MNGTIAMRLIVNHIGRRIFHFACATAEVVDKVDSFSVQHSEKEDNGPIFSITQLRCQLWGLALNFPQIVLLFGAMAYSYTHRVQFYETDEMGIVHHSNYLRFCEEARVGWAHSHGLIDYQKKGSASLFAVYETRVKHVKPAVFGDDVRIDVQARAQGVRIQLQYRLTVANQIVALAETVHVPLDSQLKLIRPPEAVKKIMEKESWNETWL